MELVGMEQTTGLYSTNVPGISFLGCFEDDFLPEQQYPVMCGASTTVFDCYTQCREYTYFALQDGGDCYCGDNYPTTPQLDNAACGVPSPDFPGLNTDGVCTGRTAVKNGSCCGMTSTAGLYSFGSVSPRPTAAPTSIYQADVAFLGCFQNGFLPVQHTTVTCGTSNTVYDCLAECSGYTYFALGNGGVCYCGNSYPDVTTFPQLDPSDCGIPSPDYPTLNLDGNCEPISAVSNGTCCGMEQTTGLYSTNVPGITFLGCFEDDFLPEQQYPVMCGASTTVFDCYTQCREYTYFALQDGGDCYCGNNYPTTPQLDNDACGAPSPDFPGLNSDGDCSGRTAIKNGSCCGMTSTAGLYTFGSVTPAPTRLPTPTPVSFTGVAFLGCFQQGFLPVQRNAVNCGTSNTVNQCLAQCTGYAYVGLQSGGLCFCGNMFPDTTYNSQFSNSACGVPSFDYPTLNLNGDCSGQTAISNGTCCGMSTTTGLFSLNMPTIGFLGCFQENILPIKQFPVVCGESTTVYDCYTQCRGYTYFALQDGGACYCGNDYPSSPQLSDEACGAPSPEFPGLNSNGDCSGTSATTDGTCCGMSGTAGLYSFQFPATPKPTPAPTQRPTPAPTPITKIAVTFLGCFQDGALPVQEGLVQCGTPNTVYDCFAQCRQYTYFQLQNGGNCFCGNTYPDTTMYPQLGDEACGHSSLDYPGLNANGNCNGLTAVSTGSCCGMQTTGGLFSFDVPGVKFLGCFEDNPLPYERVGVMCGSETTVYDCFTQCRDYTYFALQHGGGCYCGNDFPTSSQLSDAACGAPSPDFPGLNLDGDCSGMTALSSGSCCGMSSTAGLYSMDNSLTPTPTPRPTPKPSPAPTKAPVAYPTPYPTYSPTIFLTPEVTYLGCYQDNAQGDFPFQQKNVVCGTPSTVNDCFLQCIGYAFFALENGGQCYCGNNYGYPVSEYPLLDDSACGSPPDDFADFSDYCEFDTAITNGTCCGMDMTQAVFSFSFPVVGCAQYSEEMVQIAKPSTGQYSCDSCLAECNANPACVFYSWDGDGPNIKSESICNLYPGSLPTPSPSRFPSPTPPPTPPPIWFDCNDTVTEWTDANGDNCAAYANFKYCTPTGEPGPGWHANHTGNLSNYEVAGIDASSSCCACGGGYGQGSRCQDAAVPWTDSIGQTCANYFARQFCTPERDYGPGWSWGMGMPFEMYANGGLDARDACCACGKIYVPGAQTPSPTVPPSSKGSTGSCPEGCVACLTETMCTSCSGGLHLYLGQCFAECPLGTYSEPNTCIAKPCSNVHIPGTAFKTIKTASKTYAEVILNTKWENADGAVVLPKLKVRDLGFPSHSTNLTFEVFMGHQTYPELCQTAGMIFVYGAAPGCIVKFRANEQTNCSGIVVSFKAAAPYEGIHITKDGIVQDIGRYPDSLLDRWTNVTISVNWNGTHHLLYVAINGDYFLFDPVVFTYRDLIRYTDRANFGFFGTTSGVYIPPTYPSWLEGGGKQARACGEEHIVRNMWVCSASANQSLFPALPATTNSSNSTTPVLFGTNVESLGMHAYNYRPLMYLLSAMGAAIAVSLSATVYFFKKSKEFYPEYESIP